MKTSLFGFISILAVLPACITNKSESDLESGLDLVEAQPNILFIAVDDLKPMLGCYGDSLIKTPNIDKIAGKGTVFQRSYCQVPVCGASRASLLTGMYADHSEVWTFDKMRKANPDVITLPQHFKNNGYHTVNLGKIFDYRTVDKYSDSISWDHVFPVSEGDYYPHYNKETGIAELYHYQSEYVKERYQELKKEALEAGKDTFGYAFKRLCPAVECNLDLPDDAYKDGIFAKLGVQQINELSNQEKPFFLAVGFHKPHLPFVSPKKYWDMYSDEEILLAINQEKANNDVDYAYHSSGELRKYTDETGKPIYEVLNKGQKLPESEQKKLIHGYMANVSFVDAQVGKLLQALEKNGIAENTIIVLWGDHGWHLGDHNMWGKVSTFEQATWAPLIMTQPGMSPSSNSIPVEFVDIFPTLCEMAELGVPEHLDGNSLVPIMNGVPTENFAISQWPQGKKMGYAIRSFRYRYVEFVEEGLHENPAADLQQVSDIQLFDYEKDPWETENLANHPEYKEVQKKLAEELDKFYASLNNN